MEAIKQSLETPKQRAERFWSLVDKEYSGECWTWLGSVNRGGGWPVFYFWRKGQRGHTAAHRYAYAKHYGWCPAYIRSTCKTPLCIRPTHWKRPNTAPVRTELTVEQVRTWDAIVETLDFKVLPNSLKYSPKGQLAMYFGRRLAGLSTTVVGGLLSRDHSTVVHGTKLMAARPALVAFWERKIKARLERAGGECVWTESLFATMTADLTSSEQMAAA